MEGSYEEELKRALIVALDVETSKKVEEINADKISAIVKLLENLDLPLAKKKEDSLENFINKFNRDYNTNLTADTKVLRRRIGMHSILAVVGVLTPIFIVTGIIIGRRYDIKDK